MDTTTYEVLRSPIGVVLENLEEPAWLPLLLDITQHHELSLQMMIIVLKKKVDEIFWSTHTDL